MMILEIGINLYPPAFYLFITNHNEKKMKDSGNISYKQKFFFRDDFNPL